MSPDSIETYRQIMSSIQGLEHEIGDLKGIVGGLTKAIEGFSDQREFAQDQHVLCRGALEKRMGDFEERATGRMNGLEKSQNTLLTWGRALVIIGGACTAALVILNILMAIGIQV